VRATPAIETLKTRPRPFLAHLGPELPSDSSAIAHPQSHDRTSAKLAPQPFNQSPAWLQHEPRSIDVGSRKAKAFAYKSISWCAARG
jgi:hypothetical protein